MQCQTDTVRLRGSGDQPVVRRAVLTATTAGIAHASTSPVVRSTRTGPERRTSSCASRRPSTMVSATFAAVNTVGLYTLGTQVAGLVGQVTQAFGLAFQPWLFEQLTKDELADLMAFLKATRW